MHNEVQSLCDEAMLRAPTRFVVDSRLRNLSRSAKFHRNKFTPMSYLKHVARDFQRTLGNLVIEQEQGASAEQLSDGSQMV